MDELDAAIEDSPWNHPTTVEDMAVTGLCLAHANCVVGVFETKCPNALDFLWLEKIPALEDKECRVLMCTEDCPSRNFTGNHFRKVSKKPDNFELSDDLDDVDVAWDLFQGVLKVHQILYEEERAGPHGLRGGGLHSFRRSHPGLCRL